MFNVNAKLHAVAYGLTSCLLLNCAAYAQQSPPDQKPPPAPDSAAVQNGIRFLNAQPGAGLQFDRSLSLLLAKNLVSSNDLGIDVAELQPALRAQLNLPEGAGLVVSAAAEDSPGAKAGLKPHDVLLVVAGVSVGNTEQLAEALKRADGKPVKIELLRQGKPLAVEATPKSPWVAEIAFADAPVTAWTHIHVNQEPRYRIGVVLNEADETLRAQVGLAAGEGLIVGEVFPNSPAAKAGLKPHDVLVILDGKRLTAVDAINAQIQEIKEREVELKLLRGGKEVSLKIAPQKETAEATFLDAANGALTIWNPGSCPAQAQTSNCAGCHQNPFPDAQYHGRLRDYWALRQWMVQQPAPVGSPQEQVNQLKEQLAKMQETLSALDATLQAAAAKEETQPKPEEKK